jgi:hypothetical protein
LKGEEKMIDIGKILKRAWHILWNYKVLWIFGILLAITAGGGGGNGGSGYQFSAPGNGQPYNFEQYQHYPTGPEWEQFKTWIRQDVVPFFEHPDRYVTTIIWVSVGFLAFLIVLSVIFAFVRYVSETAVLRMVDGYEQTGTKVTFKEGWKLGWSRRAFRLWVIDLIIGIPAFIFVALLLGLGILFFFNAVNGQTHWAAAGMIAAIGGAFVIFMAFILLMVFLRLLRQFFARSAALEDTRVIESFRHGWATFKHNWKSGLLMWLVMLGIGIGFGLASMIVFFLLIPVYIILLIPALLVAAVPGLIAFGIASLFTGPILAGIIGGIVAMPFFFVMLFSPLALLSALYTIFESSVWTLTYREMKALETMQHPAPVEIPAEKA